MPFKRGLMPLRRTVFYLEQGKIVLRNDVAILTIGTHTRPKPEQLGASEFTFWHYAQIQYKNPHLQLTKHQDISITPYAQAFLKDGREVMFDLENMTKEEIVDVIQGTLGKTKLVKRREFLEQMQDHNPAEFGSKCSRHCMCEIQGQMTCPAVIQIPQYLRGRHKWNHNIL